MLTPRTRRVGIVYGFADNNTQCRVAHFCAAKTPEARQFREYAVVLLFAVFDVVVALAFSKLREVPFGGSGTVKPLTLQGDTYSQTEREPFCSYR